MKISIIVPVYNEDKSILKFYEKIFIVLESLSTYTYEIIFVDDGSEDNTFSIINEICIKNKNVKAIQLSKNFGKEIAMMSGFNNSIGDYIIPIDCDFQDPPELIVDMMKKISNGEGYDMVVAERNSREENSYLKSILTKIFYFVINFIDNKRKKFENHGDYRVFNKKILDCLIRYKETNIYMKGIFQDIGFKCSSIKFDRPKRLDEPKQSFYKLLMLSLNATLNSSTNPLYFIFFVSFFLLIISIFFMIFILIKKLFFIIPAGGFATITILITFFGALNLFILSLLSLYVSKIYFETKKRPLYIINNKINF